MSGALFINWFFSSISFFIECIKLKFILTQTVFCGEMEKTKISEILGTIEICDGL